MYQSSCFHSTCHSSLFSITFISFSLFFNLSTIPPSLPCLSALFFHLSFVYSTIHSILIFLFVLKNSFCLFQDSFLTSVHLSFTQNLLSFHGALLESPVAVLETQKESLSIILWSEVVLWQCESICEAKHFM